MNISVCLFYLLLFFTLYVYESFFHVKTVKSSHFQFKEWDEKERRRLNINTVQRYREVSLGEKYYYTNGSIPFHLLKEVRYPLERLLLLTLNRMSIDVTGFVNCMLNSYEKSYKKIDKLEDLSKLDLCDKVYQKVLYSILKGGEFSVLKESFTFKNEKINLLRAHKEVFYTLFESKVADYLYEEKCRVLEYYKNISSKEERIEFKEKKVSYFKEFIVDLETVFPSKRAAQLCVFEFPPIR
jgi:hypothetical protein